MGKSLSDALLGAPHVWRQDTLQDPLALKILVGKFREGDVIQVDCGAEGLVFTSATQGEVVEGEAAA